MSPSDKQKRIASAVALATAIAVPAEGLRQWAYNDTGGILTTCYGHTGSDVVKGKVYALDECKQFLNADMINAVRTVENCTTNLPVNALAAFSDITYNAGATAACDTKRSTAARYLKAGMVKEACLELPKWNKAKVAGVLVPLPGLTKRRNAEVQLCMEGL
jgi:GH24 family phage-related lysozyme (muramidase)